MNYKVAHTTTYTYSEPVGICQNEVRLTPRDTPWQCCTYNRLVIHPLPSVSERYQDYFGNHATNFSISQTHDKLSIVALSNVRIEPRPAIRAADTLPWEQLRSAVTTDRRRDWIDAYQFVFESQHVPWSSELVEYAQPSFRANRPLWEVVLDLTQRIFTEFTYDSGATTVSTPVAEVLQNKSGVCQDFAHLEIGCLRAMGIPARYVSGYLVTHPPEGQPRLIGADASHAWLSVWCPPHGWIDVDPTNNLAPSDEHITLAWGRDYQDVCPIKGVVVGGGEHAMSVSVDVLPAGETSDEFEESAWNRHAGAG